MLTNQFKVRPDPHGDITQRYAAEIYAIDQRAVCPNNPKEARAFLAELQRKQIAPRESGGSLRLTQLHESYNALLPQLAKAKKLGVRSHDAKAPAIPADGVVSPAALQEMIEYAAQLDVDIAEFEAQTPDQRRIAKLEMHISEIVKANNILVRACKEYEARIAALEAIISRPVAA
jgi:hypothetical protein